MDMKQWEEIVNNYSHDWEVIPSQPDERDYNLSAITKTPVKEMPSRASLMSYIPYLRNQGNCPFCVAFSLVHAMNAYFSAQGILPEGGLSVKFVYWMAKKYDGMPDKKGTTYKAALKVVQKFGACPESMLPFDGDCKKPEITDEMMQEAKKYRINAYAKLQNYDEIKAAIANGKFVPVATLVTARNWGDQDKWILEPDGFLQGLHATLLGEYDETVIYPTAPEKYTDFTRGANSWGLKWGDNGRYYMAREYAEFKLKDAGMPALLEAWAVSFENDLKPETQDNKEDKDQSKEQIKEFDVAPYNQDGNLMLEMRNLVELTGGVIEDWDNQKKQAKIVYPDRTVYVTQGQREYKIIPK